MSADIPAAKATVSRSSGIDFAFSLTGGHAKCCFYAGTYLPICSFD